MSDYSTNPRWKKIADFLMRSDGPADEVFPRGQFIGELQAAADKRPHTQQLMEVLEKAFSNAQNNDSAATIASVKSEFESLKMDAEDMLKVVDEFVAERS